MMTTRSTRCSRTVSTEATWLVFQFWQFTHKEHIFLSGGTENSSGTRIHGTAAINIDDGDENGNPGGVRKAVGAMMDKMRPLLKGKAEKESKSGKSKRTSSASTKAPKQQTEACKTTSKNNFKPKSSVFQQKTGQHFLLPWRKTG